MWDINEEASFSQLLIYIYMYMYIYIYIYVYFFFVVCLFRAAPAAHGGSQARGLIGAVAAGLRQSHSHSHTRSEPSLRPTPQLTATPDP